MRRFYRYIFAVNVLLASTLVAQPVPPSPFPRPVPVNPQIKSGQAVATLNVSAIVVGNVDLIIIRDLDFELTSLSPADLVINPQSDPHAGKMKIVGDPNSLVRVTFESQSVLRYVGGQSELYFTNNFSGNSSDDQRQSELLTQDNQVRLSEDGSYYLWVGGRLSGLENLISGDYVMELRVEVEYVI